MLQKISYLLKISLFISIFALFTACSSVKKLTKDHLGQGPQEIYNKALSSLQNNKFNEASSYFGDIWLYYPKSNLVENAELMNAYSLYMAKEYDEAIDVLEMFIKLHPKNEYIDYAYYLRAMSDYSLLLSVKLDQERAKYASDSIRDVINNFPNSKYSKDLNLKLALVSNHIAGHNMYIGNFYLKKNNPVAAIRRFQNVINNYSDSVHTPEALYRIIHCLLNLGLDSEVMNYMEVMVYNYPDNEWTKEAENIYSNIMK